jgi:hypothetical protein
VLNQWNRVRPSQPKPGLFRPQVRMVRTPSRRAATSPLPQRGHFSRSEYRWRLDAGSPLSNRRRATREERSVLDGPGWICRIVQHCEHAAGARSTTTDLTLVRLNSGNPNHDILPEFPRQMGQSAGFPNGRYSRTSVSVDSTINSMELTLLAPISPATWQLPSVPRPPSTGIRDPGR